MLISICVIIPTLNEARNIARLLDQLTAFNVGQILVSDGGSCDKTCEIAARYKNVEIIEAPRGRGHQIVQAARFAKADILWILHADSQLPVQALPVICKILSDNKISMGCFRLKFDRKDSILSLYEYFSRFESCFTSFGDQGFFMRSSDFHAIGGCPSWSLFEDVKIRKSLKRIGKIKKADCAIITSARRFDRLGVIKTQLLNLQLLYRYFRGSDPEQLALEYYHGGRDKRNYEFIPAVKPSKGTVIGSSALQNQQGRVLQRDGFPR